MTSQYLGPTTPSLFNGSCNCVAYSISSALARYLLYLVRRKTRKQAATRQSGEGGGITLQPSTTEETSTGSQEHVYEPMDKELLKKLEVDVYVTSQGRIQGGGGGPGGHRTPPPPNNNTAIYIG